MLVSLTDCTLERLPPLGDIRKDEVEKKEVNPPLNNDSQQHEATERLFILSRPGV